MAQSQYNFKIEDDLKEEAETLSKDFESKQEFLTTLLDSYKTCKSNSAGSDIDMSKYEDIDNQTKSLLNDAFKHIVYTLQQNGSLTRQQLISLEQDKKAIAKEREAFKSQLETIKSESNQQLLDVQKLFKLELEAKEIQITKAKDLNTLKDAQLEELKAKVDVSVMELDQVKVIAKQVELISNENTTLRAELKALNVSSKAMTSDTELKIKELMDLLSEKEKEGYRADIGIKNLEDAVENLKNEIKLEKASATATQLEIKKLEKENTVLSIRFEMFKEKEEK